MKYQTIELLRAIKHRTIEFVITLNEYFSNKRISFNSAEFRLQGKILVLSHSLEKGMGMKNVRVGYGKKKADKLLYYLFDYYKKNYDRNNFSFKEAITVLESYFALQNDWNENVVDLYDRYHILYEKISLDIENDALCAGCRNFSSQQLEDMSKYNFEEFLSLRHSIRDYQDKIVDNKLVEKAVCLANILTESINGIPAFI